jgi:hypothetical protein
MPKKKEPDLTPEEQFKRFQEAAKKHELEKGLPDIERVFENLSRPLQKTKPQKQKSRI